MKIDMSGRARGIDVHVMKIANRALTNGAMRCKEIESGIGRQHMAAIPVHIHTQGTCHTHQVPIPMVTVYMVSIHCWVILRWGWVIQVCLDRALVIPCWAIRESEDGAHHTFGDERNCIALDAYQAMTGLLKVLLKVM